MTFSNVKIKSFLVLFILIFSCIKPKEKYDLSDVPLEKYITKPQKEALQKIIIAFDECLKKKYVNSRNQEDRIYKLLIDVENIYTTNNSDSIIDDLVMDFKDLNPYLIQLDTTGFFKQVYTKGKNTIVKEERIIKWRDSIFLTYFPYKKYDDFYQINRQNDTGSKSNYDFFRSFLTSESYSFNYLSNYYYGLYQITSKKDTFYKDLIEFNFVHQLSYSLSLKDIGEIIPRAKLNEPLYKLLILTYYIFPYYDYKSMKLKSSPNNHQFYVFLDDFYLCVEERDYKLPKRFFNFPLKNLYNFKTGKPFKKAITQINYIENYDNLFPDLTECKLTDVKISNIDKSNLNSIEITSLNDFKELKELFLNYNCDKNKKLNISYLFGRIDGDYKLLDIQRFE